MSVRSVLRGEPRLLVERLRAQMQRPDRLARLAAGFVASLYLAIVVLLGAWVALVLITTGWRPVVIAGGSMQPTLRVGDVLLVDGHPEGMLGQRSVITYEPSPGGELVTHRIQEVLTDTESYVTQGDANPQPDTDPVIREQVVGVGRLVIPVLGLPLIWAANGNVVALVALGILTIAAVLTLANMARQPGRSGESRIGGTSEMANRGVRRVRFLAGLMIVGGLYFDASAQDAGAIGGRGREMVLASFGILMVINVASSAIRNRSDGRVVEWVATAELGADTVLAGALIAVTGGSGIAWAFIALPIVEAAVRFGLTGALSHWVVMTMLTVGARLNSLDRTGAPLTEIIDELERLMDQLGILLLLVIPGAYLTEQLVTDVLRQDRATGKAIERSLLLERVAETGYELNRLGSELFTTMTKAITQLGFDVGDAHLRSVDGEWRPLATSLRGGPLVLPTPGEAGSGLRPQDLQHSEVLVDSDDPEPAEVLALHSNGIELVARLTVSTDEGRHVVVRAAAANGSAVQSGSIDALRLLAGQAAVALQNKQLVSELEQAQFEMEQRALHDALTGLPNRAQFLQRLEDGLAEASDPKRRHVVMFMDLDGFKGINDTLGHEAGDELLRKVAKRLSGAVGRDGLVARLGGDEFTVLLEPVADLPSALAVAHRIHQTFAEPFILGDVAAEVGGSIGLAAAEVGLNGSEILRRADVAMYAAKSFESTPRITVYHPTLDGQDQRRDRLASDFVAALEAGELCIAYQPLVAPTGEVLGVEALLRWAHRDQGPISPAVVLELAERSDRVDELMGWVFTTALREVADCGIDPAHRFTLAVNVTPTELASPALVDTVARALAASGLPPAQLMIELNERIVADGQASLASMERLVDMGVSFSLDDFGEGRTSLAHLRGLPISQLKLDRGLVQQAAGSSADRIILTSVIGMAHELEFEVVAEGIETAEHLHVSVEAGADLLQGYGLYRPMDFGGMVELLQARDLIVPGPASPVADPSRSRGQGGG